MIYNCTSGGLNPIRWGEMELFGRESVTRIPFNDVLWYPGGSFKSSRMVNNMCITLFHVVPAYILDAVSKVTGKKPM